MELRSFHFIGAILDHPAAVNFFAEIAVKCKVKPDEDIRLKAFIKRYIMLISQSQGYYSEVLNF